MSNTGGAFRHLHSEEHGYVPPQPAYFMHDAYGNPAPVGHAFNVVGDLVKLPFDPWEDPLQMAWEDPQNPDYLEYAQGRMTIEGQPSADPRVTARYGKHTSAGHVAPVTHEDVALVPQSAYLRQNGDLVPQQDEGTRGRAVFDMPASPIRTRYILSKEILGVIQCEAPNPNVNSPLLVVPAGADEGAPAVPPFGGAVALANFKFGHLGSQISNIICDVLAGSLVKVTTVSSLVIVGGRIAPRYFAVSDTGAAPAILRQYLLFPGGPILTNDSFSNLPNNIMELQGSGPGTIVAAGAQGVPVDFQGWAGQGLSTTPSIDSLPARVFRGTVPSGPAAPAAAFTNRSRIPIPQGAQSVRIFGGFNNPVDVPQAVPIQWTQNIDVAGMAAGPFQPNTSQPIPILEGATSIDVFSGNSAGDDTIEVPFFAYFYLNV